MDAVEWSPYRRGLRFEPEIPGRKALLDIKWIRDNQDAFVAALKNRGADAPGETLNQILSLDEQRRATI